MEADRGTTTRQTFDAKITGYWHFLEQNRQIKSYGVKWFRVVTITLTQARADSLAHLASQSIPDRLRKYFLFASREHFSLEDPESIYGSIYRNKHFKNSVTLMP